MRVGLISILLLISVLSFGQPMGRYPFEVEAGVSASDDFESYGSSVNLGDQTNWTAEYGTIKINDNAGDNRLNPAVTSGEVAAFYNAITPSGNQYSQAVVDAVASGHFMGVAVRCQGDGSYYAYYGSSTTSALGRMNTGTWTTLASGGNAFVATDVVKITISGYEIRVYKNGSLDTSISTDGIYDDSASGSKLDGGDVGVAGYGNTLSADLDDWEGGDL